MRDLKGAETLSTRIREDLGSEKLESLSITNSLKRILSDDSVHAVRLMCQNPGSTWLCPTLW